MGGLQVLLGQILPTITHYKSSFLDGSVLKAADLSTDLMISDEVLTEKKHDQHLEFSF